MEEWFFYGSPGFPDCLLSEPTGSGGFRTIFF